MKKSFICKLFTEKKYYWFNISFVLVFIISLISAIIGFFFYLYAFKNYDAQVMTYFLLLTLGASAVVILQCIIIFYLVHIDDSFQEWVEQQKEENSDDSYQEEIDWEAFYKEMAEKRNAKEQKI